VLRTTTPDPNFIVSWFGIGTGRVVAAPKAEHLNGDSILLDITVNGVRETVSADVTSVKYGS
jgi:hypothetical protein